MNEAEAIMLKKLPDKMGTGLHGSIPPSRYWAYYTWQEIDAIAKHDRNATAVINVGAVEQHGPHLPLITDTLVGMELLGAALARLPDDVMVLALPPTMFGKSVEHITFPGTLTFSGDTLLEMQSELGFEALVIFPHLPGMRRPETLEQLGRFWADVRPALAARAPASQPVSAGV